MAASDLAEMEFSQDGWTLRLVRRPQPQRKCRRRPRGPYGAAQTARSPPQRLP